MTERATEQGAADAKYLFTPFCEAIWMYAAFCEGSERGSALNVLDRANDEQGAADAKWQSKKRKRVRILSKTTL